MTQGNTNTWKNNDINNGRRSCRSRQKVMLSFLNHTDKYKCPLCRYQLIRDYTLKTLRLKIDKWNKLWSSDEQRALLIKFVESGLTPHYPQFSLLYANNFLQITYSRSSFHKLLAVLYRSILTGPTISQIKGCISSRGRGRGFPSLSMDLFWTTSHVEMYIQMSLVTMTINPRKIRCSSKY